MKKAKKKNLNNVQRCHRVPKAKNMLMRLLVVVLIANFSTACSGLNTRISDRIESGGSELSGVPVGVDRVNLKIFRGSGQITGLTVANPDAYVAENAFQMDLLRLNLGVISSLLWYKPIVLDELVIDSPVVNLEMNEQGGSNLRDISVNVAKNLEQADGKSTEPEKTSDKSADESRRIVIRKLVINGVSYSVRNIDGTSRSGTLPTIELTNVGGSEGKTPGGLSTVVVVAMTREMLKEALARRFFEKIEGYRSQGFDGELSSYLGLTPEQVDRFRLIFWEELEKRSELLSRFTKEPDLSLKDFVNDWGALQKETLRKLEGTLDAEQIKSLAERQEELRKMIQRVFSSDG